MGNAWQAIDAACYAAANGRVAILDYLLAKNIETRIQIHIGWSGKGYRKIQ